MQYFRTRRQVGDLLAGLGSTCDEVATKLASSGVHGIPKDVHGCPIALYLNAIVGSESNVRAIRVDRASVQMLAGRMMIPMSVPLPEAVRAFIKAFDRRRYPELAEADRESKPGRLVTESMAADSRR